MKPALAQIGGRRFDLILLDVMMSGLDGYEVCTANPRDAGSCAAVPILMLTGLNDTASIELAYGQGATDFITKPINWTLLSHKVRYALRTATAAAEAMRRSRESLARAQSAGRHGQLDFTGSTGAWRLSAELRRLFGMPADDDQLDFPRVVAAARHGVRSRRRAPRARSRLLSEGLPYQVTFRIRRADGERAHRVRTGGPARGCERLMRGASRVSRRM